MNNCTENFTKPETSTNANITSLGVVDIFLCSISFLFGLPTNSYIIWLIVTGTGSGLASGFFHLNLSVCEIGYCLNGILAILSLSFSSLKVIVPFFQGLGIAGRCSFQCLMCVECYLAVVHPVTFLKYKPLRYRVICSAIVWIITLGSCLFSMFSLMSDNIDLYTWFFSLQFLFFFIIQLFCLVAVLRALKQSGPGDRKREEENNMKRRAFYIILIITVSMIITYIPSTVIGLFFILTRLYIKELFNFGYICYGMAAFVQPVLYVHQARKLSCLCSPKNFSLSTK